MRGAIAARSLGVFERYVEEMYRHMWAEPKKMDDPAVFRNALTEAGLDADRIFQLIETREIKNELIKNTERSVERGTFGSPTLLRRRRNLLWKGSAARGRRADRAIEIGETVASASRGRLSLFLDSFDDVRHARFRHVCGASVRTSACD